MKVCILGATGRVGSHIMKLALQDSYEVTVLVRDLSRVETEHERLQVIKGNVLSGDDIKEAIKGCDIVISALGTDRNGTLEKSVPIIIKQMEEEGIKKIVTIGTVWYFTSANKPKYISFPIKRIEKKNDNSCGRSFSCL